MAIDLIAETAAVGTTTVHVDIVRGDYTRPAVDLLPLGELIWRREEGTTTWETLEALGYLTYRANRRSIVFMRERMANKAADMLPEWETQMGLPDACAPLGTTIDERQETLGAKWAAHAQAGGEHFVSIAAALGYTVRLQGLFKPFLASVSAVGDQIQRWPYWWAIRTTSGARDAELQCRYEEISRQWAAFTFDFHDWTDWAVVAEGSADYRSVATDGQSWLIVGNMDHVLATGDFGATFTDLSGGVPAGIDWQDIAFGDNRFVAVGGDRVMVADAPNLWVPQTFGTLWRGVSYGDKTVSHGDRFIIVGSGGELRTSRDQGLTWVAQTTGSSEDLYDAAFHAGMWVVVGENGEILTSVDGGTNWTPRASNVIVDLHCVTWGNGRWVAAGNSGKICTSTDGIVWVVETVASGLTMSDVDYSEVGGFCIVGASGKFWTSTTGLAFVESTSPGSADLLAGVVTDDEGRWWACGQSAKQIKIETEHWYRLTQEF